MSKEQEEDQETQENQETEEDQETQETEENQETQEEEHQEHEETIDRHQENLEHQETQEQEIQEIQEPEQEQEQESDQEKDPSFALPSSPRPRAHDGGHHQPTAGVRRGGKRKKPSRRQVAAVQKKLRLLRENLRPIPFSPAKALDLPKHETLFKTLGLWEFANLDLDRDLRSDLIEHLIANYDPLAKCSYVFDHRINITRSHLARALRLPVKKDKSADPDRDVDCASDDSIAALSEFVSNYMLLHEDTWMMPGEIVASERLLKEGQPHKIDWAGIIWLMIDRELNQVPESGNCFYASHLQCLIRSQKPDVFKEMDIEELEEDDDDDVTATATAVAVAVTAAKTPVSEEISAIDLSVGQESNDRVENCDEDNVMEECREDQGQWFMSEKGVGADEGGDHPLRQCNFNVFGSSECERVDKDAEDERYDTSIKFSKLDRLGSSELLQEMETNHVSYGLNGNLIDPSSSEFLTQREDLHKSLLLNPGGLSMFENNNACKREMNDDDDVVRHMSHNDHPRKMKSDGPWDHSQEGFGMCLEQAQSWLNKARAMHEEKEELYARTNMHLEYITAQIHQRDSIIHSMERSVSEERNKKDMEICRLEHELCVMTQLLHGYKKALKETRTAFAEYRDKFGRPDEPIYKDVAGNGGLVLSVMELEKQRLEKAEGERRLRLAIQEKIGAFELGWAQVFEVHSKQIDMFQKRLVKIVEEVEILKQQNSKTEDVPT